MKNNVINDYSGGLAWDGQDTFKYTSTTHYKSMVYNEFKLNNIERLQFIKELTYLNQIFLVIYNKMRTLDCIRDD